MKNLQLNNAVADSFQAFLCKGAHFTPVEEYPILRKDMISTMLPKKILPFNKAITYRGDLHDTFICTYAPDASFERVRRNPKAYVDFFKRTAGIIGFDFSIHSDMQVVKQKAQINDNLSLTYYYGDCGVPVIPNLRCGIDELYPEYIQAIPKQSLVAVGTNGFIKTAPEKSEWFCFLEDVVNDLEPSAIVVYGGLTGKIFDPLKQKARFVLYDSWISQLKERVIIMEMLVAANKAMRQNTQAMLGLRLLIRRLWQTTFAGMVPRWVAIQKSLMLLMQ